VAPKLPRPSSTLPSETSDRGALQWTAISTSLTTGPSAATIRSEIRLLTALIVHQHSDFHGLAVQKAAYSKAPAPREQSHSLSRADANSRRALSPCVH
jgi:hypothetical protein